jgi:hypothetical protein
VDKEELEDSLVSLRLPCQFAKGGFVIDFVEQDKGTMGDDNPGQNEQNICDPPRRCVDRPYDQSVLRFGGILDLAFED